MLKKNTLDNQINLTIHKTLESESRVVAENSKSYSEAYTSAKAKLSRNDKDLTDVEVLVVLSALEEFGEGKTRSGEPLVVQDAIVLEEVHKRNLHLLNKFLKKVKKGSIVVSPEVENQTIMAMSDASEYVNNVYQIREFIKKASTIALDRIKDGTKK